MRCDGCHTAFGRKAYVHSQVLTGELRSRPPEKTKANARGSASAYSAGEGVSVKGCGWLIESQPSSVTNRYF